jgi:hypothetical protein
MEVTHPSWISQENAYLFRFTGAVETVESQEPVFDISAVSLPATATIANSTITDSLLTVFLEKTKKYFVSPLNKDTVKKHLRHYIDTVPPLPEKDGAFTPVWKPVSLKMKSNEFSLYWSVAEWKVSEPLIRSDFFRSKSPEPQSNLRTIHIQNTMDSLVPVSDFPLSDLPPLNFGEESPEKREVRRRIREARLKVELARLKATRMEQKYYERYGEDLQSEDSSLGSSESESDENLGKYS